MYLILRIWAKKYQVVKIYVIKTQRASKKKHYQV